MHRCLRFQSDKKSWITPSCVDSLDELPLTRTLKTVPASFLHKLMQSFLETLQTWQHLCVSGAANAWVVKPKMFGIIKCLCFWDVALVFDHRFFLNISPEHFGCRPEAW